jgi:hypothetical protein
MCRTDDSDGGFWAPPDEDEPEYPITFYLMGGDGADIMLEAAKKVRDVVVRADKIGLYVGMSGEAFDDFYEEFLALQRR